MFLGKISLILSKFYCLKALVDSYIIPDEFDSLNNGLREYNMFKEEIKKFRGVHYIYESNGNLLCQLFKKQTIHN